MIEVLKSTFLLLLVATMATGLALNIMQGRVVGVAFFSPAFCFSAAMYFAYLMKWTL